MPGITELAQIIERNAISSDDIFALDVWHIDNWTLLLDLNILWAIVTKSLAAEGIVQQGHASAARLRGAAR